MATWSPLCANVGSTRDCSGGGLCIDAINTTKDELLGRSHISESKEITEPMPPLKAGKTLSRASASVKFKDNQCEPAMHLESLVNSVPDCQSMALKRHRPLERQFVATETLRPNCTAYMRDCPLKGHEDQTNEVRKYRLALHHTTYGLKISSKSLNDANRQGSDWIKEMSKTVKFP